MRPPWSVLVNALRKRLSLRQRRRIALARVAARQATEPWRLQPDFLILGAQRCGTSSLYRYLGSHPEIVASLRKETEYFTREYGRGPGWYRAHFPLALRRHLAAARRRQLLTFEATPDYLFHPLAPERIARDLPRVRLVVILRDPVRRAWSHYQHNRRLGLEEVDFAQALDLEEERIGSDLDRAARDPGHPAAALMTYSYMRRGRYAEQLTRWLRRFPRERLLVLVMEELFEDPARRYGQLLEFLEVSPALPDTFANFSYSSGRKPKADRMPVRDEARLRKTFGQDGGALATLLERDLPW